MFPSPGHVIISGCSDGLVAISNPNSGLVIRVITDHQGAPITDLHMSPKPIQVRKNDPETMKTLIMSSSQLIVRICGA